MAATGGPAPERLALMWDYDAFPLWPRGRGTSRFGPLPLSLGLRRDLQQWSDDWSARMMIALRTLGPDRGSYEPPSQEEFDRWNERAPALLARVRSELGPGFVVDYEPPAGRPHPSGR